MDCLWLVAQGNVAQSWMKGVVAIMLLFGVLALIGYVKKKMSKNG